MWEEADIIDASIGGVDSIPEEYYDYVESLLMKIRPDIREHKQELKAQVCVPVE